MQLIVETGEMAATITHCQQLVEKLRVLSASDDAAKVEQVICRFAFRHTMCSEINIFVAGSKNSRTAQDCNDVNPVLVWSSH